MDSYRIDWNQNARCYVATIAAAPGISYEHADPEIALQQLRAKVVRLRQVSAGRIPEDPDLRPLFVSG